VLCHLQMGGMADPKKHASPHMCYLAERGRSALKGVGINRGDTPKLGSTGAPPAWTGGVTDREKSSSLPLGLCVTKSYLVVLHQRVYALIEGNPQNWSAGTASLQLGRV